MYSISIALYTNKYVNKTMFSLWHFMKFHPPGKKQQNVKLHIVPLTKWCNIFQVTDRIDTHIHFLNATIIHRDIGSTFRIAGQYRNRMSDVEVVMVNPPCFGVAIIGFRSPETSDISHCVRGGPENRNPKQIKYSSTSTGSCTHTSTYTKELELMPCKLR